MTLKIFHKLFLTLLGASGVMVLIMAIFSQWSFKTGFAEYLHNSELAKAKSLTQQLARYYEQQGSFQALQAQDRNWHQLIAQLEPNIDLPPPQKLPEPRIKKRALPLILRLSLFDQHHQFIVGDPLAKQLEQGQTLTEFPIVIQLGQTVGWLVVRQGQPITDELAEAFIKQQSTHLYWIILVAAGLALVLSWLLLRHFLKPIQLLKSGTQELAEHKLNTRIPITSQDELGQLAQHFNQMAETLERNAINQQQWITDISHELRTPLAVLQSESEALLDGVRPLNLKAIESLHQEIMGLGQLVEELHYLARADSGELVLEREALILNEVIAHSVVSIQALIQDKGLTLELEAVAPIKIAGDAQWLKQLWVNLLTNSVRYTDSGGLIKITYQLNPAQRTVQVLLDDTPPAVPSESLPYLFERLYRVDASRQRSKGGSGLGLAIAKAIVTAHQGMIAAEPSPLGGLRIRVVLPYQEGK